MSDDDGLQQFIERQIVQRTWGRIHRLEVEVVADRIVIRGFAATYHVKQLALEAVLNALGSQGIGLIELEIDVVPTYTRSGSAR